MKKRSLILLSIICILSLSLLTGLLVYAFDLQLKKDRTNNIGNSSVPNTGTAHSNSEASEDTQQPDTSEDGSYEAGTTAANSNTVEEDSGSNEANASSATSSDPTADTDTSTSTSDTDTSTSTADNAATAGDNNSDSASSSNSTSDSSAQIPASDSTHTDSKSDMAPVILGFAGDVNLDESYYPVNKYDDEGQNISACFSADLLDEMKSADVMMLNNEFSYSTRGTKTPDKSFTFRADPSRIEILEKMGVDIVSLANNHALDYGQDALSDTFSTLEKAGIDYVGAGKDLARAVEPIYYNLGGKKIAFVSASRVVFSMDWYATKDSPGMVGTYDPTLILAAIREAKANSDYVVIFVHWGVERNTHPEDYQRTLAINYIDAGADAVIGCHPHVMQGVEFYQGKPIAYSLGNYWFNATEQKSGMLKLYLEPDHTVKVQLLPVMNKDTVTYLLTKAKDKKNYYNYMEGLSYNVRINEDGFITQAD